MAKKDTRQLAIMIASQYAEVLSREMAINKVILFGSYAKMLQHPDSDIDIAVVSPDFTGDRLEDQLRLMRHRRSVDLRIEPVPFKPEDFICDDPFVKEIMDTGEVIYSKRILPDDLGHP